MGRVLTAYDIARSAPHSQATSASTADIKTLARPVGATGVFLTCLTSPARITFDDSNPSPTNGIVLQINGLPWFVPVGRSIKFTSTAAANCTIDAFWLE